MASKKKRVRPPKKKASGKRAPAKAADVKMAPAVAKAAAPIPPAAEASDLLNFFQGVASSLVAAQNQLDDASADYISSVSGKPHLLPSVFRIPKLEAEIKFGIDKVSKNGVNVLFYKDESQLDVRNQQTVNFEIVAAPPPPELPRLPNLVGTVLGAEERAGVLSNLNAAPWAGDETSVLIYKLADAVYLVSYAKNGLGNIGFWTYSSGAVAMVTLREFGAAGAADLETFRSSVQVLGARQKAFLAKM